MNAHANCLDLVYFGTNSPTLNSALEKNAVEMVRISKEKCELLRQNNSKVILDTSVYMLGEQKLISTTAAIGYGKNRYTTPTRKGAGIHLGQGLSQREEIEGFKNTIRDSLHYLNFEKSIEELKPLIKAKLD